MQKPTLSTSQRRMFLQSERDFGLVPESCVFGLSPCLGLRALPIGPWPSTFASALALALAPALALALVVALA